MISLDEFESRVEEEPKKFAKAPEIATSNILKNTVKGYHRRYISNGEGFDLASEDLSCQLDASPILQFQSQSMADIGQAKD